MSDTATTSPASPEVAAPAPAPRAGRKRRRESLTAYAVLLPGFALFCLIVAYPLGRSFQISL